MKRSTVNQFAYDANAYNEILRMAIDVHRLEPITCYLTLHKGDDWKKYSTINNIKHLASQTLFYACLRAANCILDGEDLISNNLTIRNREEKAVATVLAIFEMDVLRR